MLAAVVHVKTHIANNDGGPFGACIVQNDKTLGDKIISLERNTVLKDTDPTAHAEIKAIHAATKALKRIDLRDCTIYSTTEPCPMCFSAIHWANIRHIVYGSHIEDVKALGFRELSINNETMKQLSSSQIEISADVEKQACLDLLKYWQSHSNRAIY